MKALPIDIGARFGRLGIAAVSSDGGKRIAHCICDCGNAHDVPVSKVVSGHTASCGCLRKDAAGGLKLKHGSARQGKETREYRIWNGMVSRCHTASTDTLKAYHHRGIAVCDRWRFGDGGKHGFECFLSDMGHLPSPSYSIERRDNSKGYEPDNCFWLPRSKQNRNKRNTRWVEIDGERMSFVEAAERLGQVSPQLAYSRVHRGWSEISALITPPGERHPMIREELKKGDPVEIKFATHDGAIWNPATVVQNDRGGLYVAFDDGRRQAVAHGEGRYRIPASNGERA